MNTIATQRQSPAAVTKRTKWGLALAVLLGLSNVPFLFAPTPDGQDGPPYAVLVLSAALGLASIATAAIAWKTGGRTAIRLTVACVIVNAVTTIPALFADVDPPVKVFGAIFVLASVASAVLVLDPPNQRRS